MRWRAYALGGVLAACGVLGVTSPARALGTTHFNVYPTAYDKNVPASRSWFVYHLDHGQAADSSLTITSTTSQPITVLLFPVDATTTADGSFALRDNNSPPKDVGSWISLPIRQAVLAPRQTIHIPFHLTIPVNASVGDHIGGIAVQENVPTAASTVNGAAVKIISRVGMRIYETVPGQQTPHLTVGGFTRSQDQFSLTVHNDGNVNLQPKATITLRTVFGRQIASFPVHTDGLIAPGRSATYHVAAPLATMMPNWVTASVHITYADKNINDNMRYLVNGWYVLLGLGLVAAAVLAVRAASKRFTIQRRDNRA